ncbi:MAG TPA: crotonase/enoyl-CoA hydratase family protein [Labilithrix sp.]
MPETLAVETRDGIATVTMQALTMPPRFFTELGETFRTLARDADLRAVVLRAAGKHFSYGLDLAAAAGELGEGFSGGLAATRMRLLERIRALQADIGAVAACPVPVIAAVHGWCIGGGVDLIAACDIRLATADARFSVRETKIAIVADLGSLQRLPPLIGQAHTRELAFTGKDIGAARAKEIGLVSDVHDSREALDAAAHALAREIAANAPLTVRGVKQVLDYGAARGVEDGLAYVAAWNAAFLASEDLGEAMAAFMQKRAPEFRGK